MDACHVQHTIEPVFDEQSRVLLLGTMPSPASREEGFYYGHPQNRFWRVLASIFDEPVPCSVSDKRDLLLRHHIALWDVLASCDIEGASDASIRNAQPNDLSRIFNTADIQAVFATGTKAAQLYTSLCEKDYGMSCTALPSTSPANASMSLDDLVAVYRKKLLPYLPQEDPIVLDVAQVVELEHSIAESGTSLLALMQRAGRALAKGALDAFSSHSKSHQDKPLNEPSHPSKPSQPSTNRTDSQGASHITPRVAVLCGSGNNGGDGWVAAKELANKGYSVRIITPCPADELKAEPARTAALTVYHEAPTTAQIIVSPDEKALAQTLNDTDIIIDAILGTGFSGTEVRAPFDAWIRTANARREAGALIVAADVPSGLSAQTGKAAEPCVKADVTVTMMTLKPGLVTLYAFAFCGTVHVAPIAYLEPHLKRLGFANKSAKQKGGAAATATTTATATAAATTTTRSHSKGTDTTSTHTPASQHTEPTKSEFLRAETEDDDGYDPYSDRPADSEPLFERNPWD